MRAPGMATPVDVHPVAPGPRVDPVRSEIGFVRLTWALSRRQAARMYSLMRPVPTQNPSQRGDLGILSGREIVAAVLRRAWLCDRATVGEMVYRVRQASRGWPIRSRCAGCDHFRADVSYLPDLPPTSTTCCPPASAWPLPSTGSTTGPARRHPRPGRDHQDPQAHQPDQTATGLTGHPWGLAALSISLRRAPCGSG